MDRAVRFSLFAVGTFIGAMIVTFALDSTSESEEAPIVVQGEREIELSAEQGAKGEVFWEREAPKMEADPVDPVDEEYDFAAQEARQREIGERRAAMLDQLAANEAVDPDWAPVSEQAMSERFAANAKEGSTLVSVTCKTSLCIAEVDSTSRKQSSGQMHWRRLLGLSRGFVLTRDAEIEGHYRSRVYLAREGHDLPK